MGYCFIINIFFQWQRCCFIYYASVVVLNFTDKWCVLLLFVWNFYYHGVRIYICSWWFHKHKLKIFKLRICVTFNLCTVARSYCSLVQTKLYFYTRTERVGDRRKKSISRTRYKDGNWKALKRRDNVFCTLTHFSIFQFIVFCALLAMFVNTQVFLSLLYLLW